MFLSDLKKSPISLTSTESITNIEELLALLPDNFNQSRPIYIKNGDEVNIYNLTTNEDGDVDISEDTTADTKYFEFSEVIKFGTGAPVNVTLDSFPTPLYVDVTGGVIYIFNNTLDEDGNVIGWIATATTASGTTDSGDEEEGIPEPTISMGDSVTEGEYIIGSISDYNSDLVYSAISNSGDVVIVNDKIKFTPDSVAGDSDVTIILTVTDGETSTSTVITLSVVNVPKDVDVTLTNDDFEANEAFNNGFEY